MAPAIPSVLVVNKFPQMVFSSICVSREYSSCFLPLQEILQGQQVVLTRARFIYLFVFSCLIYFTQHNVFKIHPCCRSIISSFLLSVQFSSVAQSCLTLCDSMDCSMPGFPVHHQLLELIQTHVYRVGDALQPFQTLSSPSLPTFNLSQHWVFSQGVSTSHQAAKVLEFQLQQ